MSATQKTGGTRFSYTAAELDALHALVSGTGECGMSRPEALAAMPMHRVRMQFLLRVLCDQGRLGSVGWTRWTRYYTPAIARQVARRERDAKRERDEASAVMAEQDQDPCPIPIRRIIVPANQAVPLMPAGPRSVFDLARVAA